MRVRKSNERLEKDRYQWGGMMGGVDDYSGSDVLILCNSSAGNTGNHLLIGHIFGTLTRLGEVANMG